MPKTEEQYKNIREGKSQLIMDTALELFVNDGYHSASISKIAKKAGISKGLMYNYFDSKEELLKSIVYNGLNNITQLFDSNKDGYLTEDEFDFFVDEGFRLVQDNLDFWKLYFMLIFQTEVRNIFLENLGPMIEPMMLTLIEYYTRKAYDEPEAKARLFFAMMDGISMHYILFPEGFPFEEIKKIIIKKFK